MRYVHRSLLFLVILFMSAGVAWGSSQAEDDPGMADGYRRMQESDARYRFEQQARRQEKKGSILEEAADNDAVTGLLGEGIEKVASKVLGRVAGKILGNLPVDDIAKVVGRCAGGDTEGAVQAYATGWVGFLSGTIASLFVKGAVAGTAVATSMPTLTAVGVVGIGIGVSYLAKKGFEYLLDMGKSKAPRRPIRLQIPKGALPSNVRLTDEQLSALRSTINGLNPPASQPATLPPASHTASITNPELPVATEPKPPATIPEAPPPTTPTTNQPAGAGQTATAEPAPVNTSTTKTGTGTNVSEPGTAPLQPPPTAAVPPRSTTRTPRAPTKRKPPKRTVPANQTCPSCGVRTTTYNTPLCTKCTARINLDRAMQRAAEAKGQKRKPRESQYWKYLPK